MNPLITQTQAKAWLQITPDQTADDTLIDGLCASASDFFLILTGRSGIAPATYTERLDGTANETLVPSNLPILSVASLSVNGRTLPVSSGFGSAGYYFDADQVTLCGGGVNFPWSPGIPSTFAGSRGNVLITYTAGFGNQSVAGEAVVVPSVAPYSASLLNAATFVGGLTLTYASSGEPLAAVAGVPTVGQYVISPTGILTFAAADAGANLVATYQVLGIPPSIQQCVTEMVGWAYKNRDRIGITTQSFPQAGLNNSYAQTPFSPLAKATIKNYTRKVVRW